MNGVLYLLPGALLGAVVSYFLPVIIGLPKYIWQIFKGEAAAEGTWYSYHSTRMNNATHLRRTRWMIKRNFRGQFTARCWGDNAGPLYKRTRIQGKGIAFREAGFLVIAAKSTSYHGHWTIRILDPLVPEETFYPGLWLSYDFDGKLIAGPILFTRQIMPEPDARLLLRNQICVSSVDRQLRVESRRRAGRPQYGP
jgi:hypothetical protein